MIFVSRRVSDASAPPPAGGESPASFLPLSDCHFRAPFGAGGTPRENREAIEQLDSASGQIPESLQGGNQMILRSPSCVGVPDGISDSSVSVLTFASGVAAFVPPFSRERRRSGAAGAEVGRGARALSLPRLAPSGVPTSDRGGAAGGQEVIGERSREAALLKIGQGEELGDTMEETSSRWQRWGRGISLHQGGADTGSAHTRQLPDNAAAPHPRNRLAARDLYDQKLKMDRSGSLN